MTNFYVEHQYSSGEEHREWGHLCAIGRGRAAMCLAGRRDVAGAIRAQPSDSALRQSWQPTGIVGLLIIEIISDPRTTSSAGAQARGRMQVVLGNPNGFIPIGRYRASPGDGFRSNQIGAPRLRESESKQSGGGQSVAGGFCDRTSAPQSPAWIGPLRSQGRHGLQVRIHCAHRRLQPGLWITDPVF